MSTQNRRKQMEKKRGEFLQALDREMDECSQSLDHHQLNSEQDSRLTTKHIRTLTFLQDIVNENKSLKLRNEELEAVCSDLQNELSQCSDLHRIAKQSQDYIETMEKEYVDQTNNIRDMLLQKHESELHRLVNEKLELEKSWATEKSALQNECKRLKASINDLTESLSQARASSDSTEIIKLKIDALSEENALLKTEHSRYSEENANLRSEVESLHFVRNQNEKLENDIKSATQLYKELQLKYEKLLNSSDDSGDKSVLMDQVKNKLTKLTHERRMWTERCGQFEEENQKLIKLLHEYAEQIKDLECKKEELDQEILSLRDQLKKKRAKPDGERNFKDFVNLKREVVALKEENEELATKMRSRLRAQSLLPALKGPEPKVTVDRRISLTSAQSKRH